MTIINKSGECYVKLCPECGTAFRYGITDILVADSQIVYTKKYPGGVCAGFNHLFCPECGELLSADKGLYCGYMCHKE